MHGGVHRELRGRRRQQQQNEPTTRTGTSKKTCGAAARGAWCLLAPAHRFLCWSMSCSNKLVDERTNHSGSGSHTHDAATATPPRQQAQPMVLCGSPNPPPRRNGKLWQCMFTHTRHEHWTRPRNKQAHGKGERSTTTTRGTLGLLRQRAGAHVTVSATTGT